MGAQNHKTVTSPAPIGGLNVQDSLAAMPATDATVLRNFWSQPYGLEVRKGCVRHATGLGGAVETIFSHVSARSTAVDKYYVIADGSLYDVTDPGDQPRVAVLEGLTNSRFEDVSITNASGYNTLLTNGIDDPVWIHDDNTVSRITEAVDPDNPAAGEISGVDPALFTTGTLHQKRLWFVEAHSTRAWYLDPEALSGDAYKFDFGAVFTKGGKLLKLASWTLDSGLGPDDKLVAISDLGEIAIYSGTDPSSAATFGLSGVFYTGAPLSVRGIATVAGDLLLLTQFGLLSMNAAMATSDTTDSSGSQYLSSKIQYLLSGLASKLANQFGWELVNWPDTNMILINVPLYGGVGMNTQQVNPTSTPSQYNKSGQLVQSTITKGWCPFDNWDAVSWMAVRNRLMFGDKDGNVWRAWEGYTDGAIQHDANEIEVGEAIDAECQTAFNFFGNQSSVKHAKLARPTFMNASRIPYTLKMNSDFSYEPSTFPGAANTSVADLWNHGLWNKAKWKGGLKTQKLWTAVSGIGAAFALRLAVSAAQPVIWATYDLMYEDGRNI
jgi:hypothetical protein